MDYTPVNLPSDVVEAIAKLKFTEILELEQIGIEKAPTLNFGDSLVVATENDLTLRVTVDQLMQYLNENLRNFIMWKPVVTNKSLVWERSNDDTQPMPLDWADILFPIVSETENGMMTTDLYKKLRGIDAENIVYKNALDAAIATRAPKEHTHEQYLLAANLPKKVSAFENDAKYITLAEVPKEISYYTNDVKYVRLEDIPLADNTTTGLMTSDTYNALNNMLDNFINMDQFNEMVEDINNVLNNYKLSSFDNDVGYLTPLTVHPALDPFGGVNLLANSDFRMRSYPDMIVDSWVGNNATVSNQMDDDFLSWGIVTLQPGGYIEGYLTESLSSFGVISFNAKYQTSGSENTASVDVELAGTSNSFVITKDMWKPYSFKIENDFTTGSNTVRFVNNGSTTVVMHITNIKIENGKLKTVYSPSLYDIIHMHQHPPLNGELGSVRPDDKTITVDEGGYLHVVKGTVESAAFIDDENVSETTVFSSDKTIRYMESNFASLDEDKIIKSEFLPSYVDDVVEGSMTVDSEGNYVFVIDDPGGGMYSSVPATSKIYLDVKSNMTYRWSGSQFVQCTTDKLGGAVLVKYDNTDKYMYFVFPEE